MFLHDLALLANLKSYQRFDISTRSNSELLLSGLQQRKRVSSAYSLDLLPSTECVERNLREDELNKIKILSKNCDLSLHDLAYGKWYQGNGERNVFFLGNIYTPPESKSKAKEIQRKFREVAVVDVQKYKRQGEVVLVGVFSSRLGKASDPNENVGQCGEATRMRMGQRRWCSLRTTRWRRSTIE